MRVSLLALIALTMPSVLVAQSSPPAPPPAPAPAGAGGKPLVHFKGLDETDPVETRGPRPAGPRGQLFVAPSGEPFRAPQGAPYPVVDWFKNADANHDGKLDRPEFRADFERFFKTLDTDHNGQLDSTEIAHYERDILPEVNGGGVFSGAFGGGQRGGFGGRGGRGGHRGGGGDYGGPRLGLAGNGAGKGGQDESSGPVLERGSFAEPVAGAGRFGLINIPEPVVSMDANIDGIITLFELHAAADRRFDLLDPDKRGYLLLDELPRTPVQRGGFGDRRGRRGRD